MAYNTANITGVITYNLTSSANTSIGTTSNSGTISIGNTSSALIAVVGGTAGISLSTATTGHISINPATTGAVTLGTTSTGNVSVGNTTGTTSIQFGTGSALSTYITRTSFTPTLVGRSVAGATTYSTQTGAYIQIGSLVWITFLIITTAQTGTGDVLLGGFPLTMNATDTPQGSAVVQGLAWPALLTNITIAGLAGTTTAVITGCGSSQFRSNIQMANAATVVYGTLMYSV